MQIDPWPREPNLIINPRQAMARKVVPAGKALTLGFVVVLETSDGI